MKSRNTVHKNIKMSSALYLWIYLHQSPGLYWDSSLASSSFSFLFLSLLLRQSLPKLLSIADQLSLKKKNKSLSYIQAQLTLETEAEQKITPNVKPAWSLLCWNLNCSITALPRKQFPTLCICIWCKNEPLPLITALREAHSQGHVFYKVFQNWFKDKYS